MKITEEDLSQLGEILNSIEDFRPIIHAVMQTIDSYGPELAKYPKVLASFDADITSIVYERYRENGFDHEDALLLTINQRVALQEVLRKMQNNKLKLKAKS